MNIQKVMLLASVNFSNLNRALNALPDGHDISPYSSHDQIDFLDSMTLETAKEIVKSTRLKLGLSSQVDGYHLGTYYPKKSNDPRECLRLTYHLAKTEDFGRYRKGIMLAFKVRNPAKTLKDLGVTCRIQKVHTEAKTVEHSASDSRQVVCSR
jgi:hypothetical protein